MDVTHDMRQFSLLFNDIFAVLSAKSKGKQIRECTYLNKLWPLHLTNSCSGSQWNFVRGKVILEHSG
jgi:hypothetical protein